MSSSTKAAIHVAPKYSENYMVNKNADYEEIQNYFAFTHRLIAEDSEDRFRT